MTEGSGRVLLVGVTNPYGADPEFALYPYPPGCSGYRLRRILGLPEDQYLALHRKNLCEGDWSMAVALPQARCLVEEPAEWSVIVMLGRDVAKAFNYHERPFFTRTRVTAKAGHVLDLVSLPHPSGRNCVWNAAAPRRRARQLLREVAPEVPWGSADDGTVQGVVA